MMMKKGIARYEKGDHLSYIKANLKEMKNEVSDYLKKTNIETIPPILRARNYLIVSYIHNLNSKDSEEEKGKMRTDLSSQILGSALDGEQFEPLRQANSKQSLNSTSRKHKRNASYNNDNSPNDYLFPNINQLKLDFEDKNCKDHTNRKNILQGKSMRINGQKKDSFLRVRKYLSIDLVSKSKSKINPQLQSDRNTENLLYSVGRDLVDKLHRQYQDNIRQKMAQPQQDAFSTEGWLASKGQIKVKRAVVNQKLVSIQRRQEIMKRRVAVSSEKMQNSQIIPYQHKELRPPRYKKDKDLYCPWEQQNVQQQESTF